MEDIEWNHGIFIVVSCKTGLEKPDKESLPSISTLLKFRQSVGILCIFSLRFVNLIADF